jgi:hypothetical protein
MTELTHEEALMVGGQLSNPERQLVIEVCGVAGGFVGAGLSGLNPIGAGVGAFLGRAACGALI